MDVSVKWKGDLCFEGFGESKKAIIMDVPNELGVQENGTTPMETLLVALGGCTGMDVITILKKMRSDVEDFNINIYAERAELQPRRFIKININYQLQGPNIEKEKVEKAIKLTQEKYCSVLMSLNSEFSFSYEINGIEY